MSITRLLLLRHGRTAWNGTGKMQGQADIPLDDTGLAEARTAAAALARRPIAAVVSSDLLRATRTAEIVAAPHGLPVVTDPRLREIDMGSWTGRELDDIVAEFPEFATLYWEGRDYRRSETGEAVADVVARAEPALRECVAANRGREVLVVCHGFMISQLAQKLVGLGATDRVLGGLDNCHWTEVGFPDDGKPWIISHNAAG